MLSLSHGAVILKYLSSLLARVVEFSDVNKMSKQNLGVVFGPNLLRLKNADLKEQLQDNPIINDITKTLIEEQAVLFQNFVRYGLQLKFHVPLHAVTDQSARFSVKISTYCITQQKNNQ